MISPAAATAAAASEAAAAAAAGQGRATAGSRRVPRADIHQRALAAGPVAPLLVLLAEPYMVNGVSIID